MCFSPEADVAAAIVVGAIGIDALRHVERRNEIPLAVLPLLFAVHSLVEAFVWWGLLGDVSDGVGRFATWVYLLIAFGLLPVLVPLAVDAVDPTIDRRRVRILAGVGAVVSAILLFALVRGPITTTIHGHHIEYEVDLTGGGVIVAAYVLATCGALMLSHQRHVRWYGAANLLAAVALAWIDRTAFISLWCLWAAITSVAIALHLRRSTSLDVAIV